MRGLFFLFFIPISIFADSFITKKEYAQNLYYNPRGVGCNHCHGDNGEGKLLATYIEDGVKKDYYAKAINDIPYTDFYKQLKSRIKGMPRYYLTDNEIQILYYYLHPDGKKKDAKPAK